MKLKPLQDRLILSYSEEVEKTAGGIYIPDSAKEKPQQGKVEAVGKEVKEIKAGDVVLFPKFSGDKITVDGEEQLVIKEEDILAIVK